MSTAEEVVAGFLGGAMSGPACCFMELVMIQQQRHGGTMFNTPVRLVKERGWSSLLRGNVTSTMRESAYAAGYLGIVPATQKYLARNYDMPAYQGDTIGALIGSSFCAFISHPLDTVKTCMQGDVEQATCDSLKHLEFVSRKRVDFVPCIVDMWRYGNIFPDFMMFNTLMRATATDIFSYLVRYYYLKFLCCFRFGKEHTHTHTQINTISSHAIYKRINAIYNPKSFNRNPIVTLLSPFSSLKSAWSPRDTFFKISEQISDNFASCQLEMLNLIQLLTSQNIPNTITSENRNPSFSCRVFRYE